MFNKNKWTHAIYGIVFLITGIILIIKNDGNLDSLAIQLFLIFGSVNLLYFAFKALKKGSRDLDLKQNPIKIFQKGKWENAGYGLFFLVIAIVWLIRKEGTIDSLAIQILLLFGGVNVLLFIFKVLKIR